MSALRVVAPSRASPPQGARRSLRRRREGEPPRPFFHLDRTAARAHRRRAPPARRARGLTEPSFLRAARQGSLRRGPRLLRRRSDRLEDALKVRCAPKLPAPLQRFCHRSSRVRRSRRRRLIASPRRVFARFIPPAAMRTRVRASMFDGARVAGRSASRALAAPARRPGFRYLNARDTARVRESIDVFLTATPPLVRPFRRTDRRGVRG